MNKTERKNFQAWLRQTSKAADAQDGNAMTKHVFAKIGADAMAKAGAALDVTASLHQFRAGVL